MPTVSTKHDHADIGTRVYSWAHALIIVEIEWQSASIYYRSFEERLSGAASLLGWAVRRIRTVTSDDIGIAIVTDVHDAASVASAIDDDRGVRVFARHGQRWPENILESYSETKRAVFVDMPGTLLPASVWESFWRRHCESGSHITILGGSPLAQPLVAVEKSAQQFVSDIQRQRRSDWRRAMWQSASVPDPGHAGRRIAVNVTHLNDLGQAAGEEWPLSVGMQSPRDVEILRRIAARVPDCAQMEFEPLTAWNSVSAEMRVDELKSLGAPPPLQRARKESVLFAQSPSAFSGVEQVVVNLALGWRSQYNCYAVLGRRGEFSERLRAAGVAVHVADREFGLCTVDSGLYAGRLLDDINPSVVNAHTGVGVPFCLAVAARRIPFVQCVHVAEPAALQRLKDQLHLADAIVAPSEFVKARLARVDVPAERVHVVHYGVPRRPRVDRDRAWRHVRKALQLEEDAVVILMPARFAANKRHDVAVQAFAAVVRSHPRAYLLCAGEAFPGSEHVKMGIEQKAAELGVGERVQFVGFWRRMEILYAASDVLLLPSENDPFPVAILEAMSLGVPVIAARSGGVPEMVTHGETGFLIEPGDVDAYASALMDLLTNREMAVAVAQRAKGECRKRFALDRYASDMSLLLKQVIGAQ